MTRAIAIASVAFGAVAIACASPQFAARSEHDVPASSAAASAVEPPAPAASAPATSAPRPASDAPAASSASAGAKAHKKTIVARHVLVQWMGCKRADTNIVRSRDQARKVVEDVLRRLQAGEDFARVVLDFSDEPNAGRRGGSLPPFGRGTMDKKFEEAAFALAPGELSGVVETEFGFHVIQRLE